MSLPIPLTVRLRTDRSDRHVTLDVRDLVMRWTDPGGYASCQIGLDRPLATQPDEIAAYGALTVYDARSGATVWDGRLEDPGRSAGANGQIWDLVAVGGSAHTLDRTVPLVYVDRTLSAWNRADNPNPGGQDQVGADPGDAAGLRQALILRWNQGFTLATGTRVVMRYNRLVDAGQRLARVAYSWDTGMSAAVLQHQVICRTDGNLASGDTAINVAWNTAGGTSAAVVVTNWTAGRNTADLRTQYTSGTGPAGNDTWWASFWDLVVRSMLVDRTGADITTGYTNNSVLASEVVVDLLGRLLTQYDGAGAVVTTTAYAIDQLAYPDGVTPNRVLADLMALDSGYTWRVWERNSSGKFRFEWTAIPAAVRYEADVVDGYDSQGSASGLYDAVTVRWRDTDGTTRQTIRTQTVPALTAAGLTRQGQIDLGQEVGSLTNAQTAGDEWLADRASPANAGRLRIARPIVDLERGQMVQPWEIRPGLIRVRGIMPRPDVLNQNTRDGVTIFRIVSAEYRASDASAVLELDSYAPSTARALADLQTATIRR